MESPPPPPAAGDPPPSSSASALKSIAESKLRSQSLKSALKYARRARAVDPTLPSLSNLITALKILRADPTHHYKILRLDPFSPISAVKKQYHSLALALHPDKTPGAEDAFKRVADSFRFLSNRNYKKQFDLQLRVSLTTNNSDSPSATFWTACTTCNLLHEFDRQYINHRLICPVCRKSFLAEEADTNASANHTAPTPTAARSRVNTRPRVLTDWTDPATAKKPRREKEQTLAEMQMELTRERNVDLVEEELSLMVVEDSDFYDFDKDRMERSFGVGQVWGIYDDDDGMPRHYGRIDDVRGFKPFRLRMSWLDVEGVDVSCGRFKVGKKVEIDSVNLFSHMVECERASNEVYRIYPKKGAVWALYSERSLAVGEARSYDIVVCLTGYSEMYGVSIAYLEKVQGFKTIFKRREVGCHAVRLLQKNDMRLFSHQVPARKVTEVEGVDLPKNCWELDPASLPRDLLQIGWERE